jgi:uncharacterized iron-regulated membrane protein
MEPHDPRWIQAHEVGEYVFCARAWWHRRQGHPVAHPEQAEAGRRHHHRLGRRRRWGERLIVLAALLLLVGTLLLIVARLSP